MRTSVAPSAIAASSTSAAIGVVALSGPAEAERLDRGLPLLLEAVAGAEVEPCLPVARRDLDRLLPARIVEASVELRRRARRHA